MEGKNWLEQLSNQTQMIQILETNQYSESFGLILSQEDASLLAEERTAVLKQEQRIEFGQSILPKIIYAFCNSSFMTQDTYRDTLLRLQEIFYYYKNEMLDEITDDELLEFMREQFETVCYGDLDYLESTCLDIFAQAIRAGYTGYIASEGRGEFEKFDITKRWDKDLYLAALKELC
ncbi:MAG: hypothetical protein HFH82_12040 [Lachnospiraceae bacterium]|nr:hypothetical protein [Lachnospiraceae bacterium]